MRATAAATKSATHPVLAAPAKAGPTSAAVFSWQAGTGCSPRINVAYSFLRTLNWLREKLHHIVSHRADRYTHPSTVDIPVVREKGKTMPVPRGTGAASA
jgi:hypothetical protein